MSRTALLTVIAAALACGPTNPQTTASTGSSGASTSTGMPTMTSGSATVTGTTAVPTSSVSETITDTTADTTETGVDFVDPSAGCETESGDSGATVECDVWDQDCCPGDKCMPWANDGGTAPNATHCVAIDPGGGAPRQPCTVIGSPASGVDDCDATSYCFDIDPGTLMGICTPFCQGGPEAPVCAEGTECFVFNDGVIPLCLAQCDPLADDCPEGQACQWLSEEQLLCAPFSGGKMGTGDPCEQRYECDQGDYCLDTASYPGCAGLVGCCSPYCDATDPGGDAPCVAIDFQMTCMPLFGPGEAPAGLEHLGVCSLP